MFSQQKYLITLFAALVIATSMLVTGCVDGSAEMFVVRNTVVRPPDCDTTGGATTEATRTRGVLDLLLTQRYLLYPVIENNLVPAEEVTFSSTGGGGGGGLAGNEFEANRLTLREAVVSLEAPDAFGIPLPRNMVLPVSGHIEPGELFATELKVITEQLGENFRLSPFLQEDSATTTLLVRVVFRAVTAAGRWVESAEYVYPLDVCVGCLIDIPLEAIDEASAVQPNCLDRDTIGNIDEPCNLGQDQEVDCRLVCPSLSGQLDLPPDVAAICGTN